MLKKSITIPYSKLADYLSKAEDRGRPSERVAPVLRPGVVKLRREETPPSEPRSGDVRNYWVGVLEEAIKAKEK